MKPTLIFIFIRSMTLLGFIWMKMKNVHVKYSSSLFIKGIPLIKNRGKFTISNNVKINSMYRTNPIGGIGFCTFIVEKGAKLMIDSGARISNITINCKEEVYIGKDVFIGGDTRIYDSDFHSLNLFERLKDIDNDIKSAPVIINSGVFIGASVMILKGVEIGSNSIIGAGSVVSKNIPEKEIWAGNPAKYIRSIDHV